MTELDAAEIDPTGRQKEVAQLVLAGVPRTTIARNLGISVSTVHSDMQRYLEVEEKGIHQLARKVRQQVLEELIIDHEQIRQRLVASLRHLDGLIENDDAAAVATNDFPGIRLLAAMSCQTVKQLHDWLETTIARAPPESKGQSSGVKTVEELRECIIRSPALARQFIEAGIDDVLRDAQEQYSITKREAPIGDSPDL